MIIDKIQNASLYYGISEKISIALKYLEKTDLSEVENGKYEIKNGEIFVIVQDYNTKPLSEGVFEAHRKFIDVQFMIKGREKMGYVNVDNLIPATEYDEEKDIIFFEGNGDFLTAEEKTFVIFMPKDAHMPGIELEASKYVKKAVIKIKI